MNAILHESELQRKRIATVDGRPSRSVIDSRKPSRTDGPGARAGVVNQIGRTAMPVDCILVTFAPRILTDRIDQIHTSTVALCSMLYLRTVRIYIQGAGMRPVLRPGGTPLRDRSKQTNQERERGGPRASSGRPAASARTASPQSRARPGRRVLYGDPREARSQDCVCCGSTMMAMQRTLRMKSVTLNASNTARVHRSALPQTFVPYSV